MAAAASAPLLSSPLAQRSDEAAKARVRCPHSHRLPAINGNGAESKRGRGGDSPRRRPPPPQPRIRLLQGEEEQHSGSRSREGAFPSSLPSFGKMFCFREPQLPLFSKSEEKGGGRRRRGRIKVEAKGERGREERKDNTVAPRTLFFLPSLRLLASEREEEWKTTTTRIFRIWTFIQPSPPLSILSCFVLISRFFFFFFPDGDRE